MLAETLTPSPPPLQAVPPDEELVARARQGDRGAFRALVERHQAQLAATVVGMLGPGAEVDDVVQEVFIRFFRSLDRFRGDASVRTYLKRIAINRSLDVLRRRKRRWGRFLSRDDDEAALPEPAVDGAGTIDARERERLVHRAVVVLRMIEGYSTEETADMLDIAYGTVLSRLFRAQDKLRDLLRPYLQENITRHPTSDEDEAP